MSLHKHRSRIVTQGLTHTPNRAFLRATGLDDAALEKSMVGIVSTQGENTPCSMGLAPLADRARLGVAAGGGVPVSFSTISMSDGTSMNHGGMRMSLVSRETIADSVELAVRAHGYDGLIAFAGCDKTLPAMMMALLRVNVPGVFMYGGATLPGRLPSLVKAIAPAVKLTVHQGGSALENATRQNIVLNVEKLKYATPIIGKLVAQKKVRIVGGIYRLDTGRVEILS